MRRWHVLVGIIVLAAALWFILSQPKTSAERAMANYGEDLMSLSKKYKVPWKYLMALTVLECSGDKPCPSRLERHVFEQLQQLRDGKKKRYGAVQQSDIDDAGDEALKNLASSWGPFQVMGYHCIQSEVTVAQLRSDEGLDHAVRWINANYGDRLRKQEWQDAFHIHNTGKPFPKSGSPTTHDPQYVFRGIALMEEFENMRKKKQ